MNAPAPFSLRHAMLCALLWSLGMSLAESLSQPVVYLGLTAGLQFTLYVAATWLAPGLIWIFTAREAETSDYRWAVLGGGGVLAWSAAMGANLLPLPSDLARSGFMPLKRAIPTSDLACYLIWVNLFYGGLYVAGYLSTRRALALRVRLNALRLVREEADLKLSETRLRAWRGQLQPEVLLQALGRLRELYAQDRAAADVLFDHLVAFLRAAMPGLRSGASTLAAELELLRTYRALRGRLDGGAPDWRLADLKPLTHVNFPPMTLLPALDRASRRLGAGSVVELATAVEPQGLALHLTPWTKAPTSPGAVSQVLDDLQSALGGKCVATAHGPTLRLPLWTPATTAARAPAHPSHTVTRRQTCA